MVRSPIAPQLPPAGSGRGGYYKDDGPGVAPPPKLDEIPDAEVKAEPYARYANRPYVVFGKTYTPMLDEQPFVQKGMSSWYGKKFHGQRTSSGEIYDMYKMTAAHPTLPIPSYARITNSDNGKQVVVRINDRGPFHSSRIVDVSYTAALKLGLLSKGSGHVTLGTRAAGRCRRDAPGGGQTRGRAGQSRGPTALQGPDEVTELLLENRAEIKSDKARPDGDAAPTPPAGMGFTCSSARSAGPTRPIRSRTASGARTGSAPRWTWCAQARCTGC
ncbi:septal ring lytic transglycosylase RlpA family protein [Massilia sp. B-10]|nr:septal ring lytic transglycosylase RlpA family protein [Massilia sp. B-10]